MNISKSDFKKIYNLTKNYSVKNYKNLISDIENNSFVNEDIKYVVNKNGKDEIINTLNKLNNFSFNKKYNVTEKAETENSESKELINNFTNFISKNEDSSSDLNLNNINLSDETLNEEPNTSVTSFNVDYDYDYMNQEVINTATSVTSEDNNVFQQSNEPSKVNYNDINELVNSLLDSEVDSIQPKNINKKYLSKQNDIDSILNMF